MNSKTKTQRIAFIDSYHSGLYGAPKSMLSLANGLHNKGYNVTIITTKDGLLSSKAKDDGLNVNIFNVPNILLLSRRNLKIYHKILYLFSLCFLWCKSIFSFSLKEYDVVCINDIRTFLFFLPSIFMNKKKIVWYVRINDRVKLVSYIAARISDKIILISNDCYSCFSENEKIRYSSKFNIVHTGFNLPDKKNLKKIQFNHKINDKVFITIGSICKRKNQKSIINSFSNLKIENKHLYILGSPTSDIDNLYYNEIIKQIKELNLTGNISLIPHTPYIYEYLFASDIFLFASHKEGLPRVIIEALSAGCFVISSKVDGIYDIIKNDNLGFVTQNCASDTMFPYQFEQLLNTACHLEKNREIKIKFILDNFSYNHYLNNFIKQISKYEKENKKHH